LCNLKDLLITYNNNNSVVVPGQRNHKQLKVSEPKQIRWLFETHLKKIKKLQQIKIEIDSMLNEYSHLLLNKLEFNSDKLNDLKKFKLHIAMGQRSKYSFKD